MIALVHNIVPHKTCAKCGESKAHSEFHKHANGGLHPRCKTCRKAAAARPWPDKRKNVVVTENGRTCLKCGEAKSWDEFAKDVHGFNQKTATCSECRNKSSRENYPDKRTLKDRVHYRYGVTWDHIVQTLANQFGRCANHGCSKEISLDVKGTAANRAVIDHDHKTGKFRALLCGGCNVMLGVLESESAKVLGLMNYMNNHKAKE